MTIFMYKYILSKVARICYELVQGHMLALRENFKILVLFGAFLCIFCSNYGLKNSLKINILLYKSNYYISTRLVWDT